MGCYLYFYQTLRVKRKIQSICIPEKTEKYVMDSEFSLQVCLVLINLLALVFVLEYNVIDTF